MSYYAKVHSAQTVGLSAEIIDIETDISKNTLHAFSIVGLPDKAVEEARDRVSAAIKNSGFQSPKSRNQKIIISLAPADIKKEGPLFDLPIALSYLLSNKEIYFEPSKKLFLGELSLDGRIRPIKGALPIAKKAADEGFEEIYLPKENSEEGALIGEIRVYPVSTLSEIIAHLDKTNVTTLSPKPKTKILETETDNDIDFSDIRGQETAKRGLMIAAAGGHNAVMYGPPGTGKTMLAKAFSAILPNLSFEETIEVTGIHSVAGILEESLVTKPPFRSPHHTSSYVSLVGGGSTPRPGEITLAHRGVLFLDEFPEFEKRVIEALRQPLEDRVINISRAKKTEKFPANFILIAAMNPCPCGNKGSDKLCVCNPNKLLNYERKISGPITDRVDIWLHVGKIDSNDLIKESSEKQSRSIKEIVSEARALAKERLRSFNLNISSNAEISAKDINNVIPLSSNIKKELGEAAQKYNLSPRAFHKIIKVARTIADLEKKDRVLIEHIMEALQYRPRSRDN